MRIVTVDIGNTNSSVCVFENNQLQNSCLLSDYVNEAHDKIIVTSVKKEITVKYNFNLNDYKKNNSFFDMPFNYSEKLGIDRLVVAYLSFKNNIQKSSNKILVIDAGTFMTMDLVTTNGFEGGFIFPGIQTYLNSYSKGELLSAIDYKINNQTDLPHNSEQAILSACDIYLKSILLETIKRTSPSCIQVTGGSMEIIKKFIETLNLSIEIQSDPNYLHLAMNLIHHSHLKDL